jgi:hypothetical protein
MDPLTKFRRRPFMAPLLIPLLGILMAAAGVYWLGTWARTTVVVLVRHAEAGESTSGDPDLSPAGEKRVAALGALIDDALADRKVERVQVADQCHREQRLVRSCRSHQAGASGQDGGRSGLRDDSAGCDQSAERQ